MTEQMTKKRTGRIVKNTIFLFIRMFVLMIINLIIVKFLLQYLGQSDYGLYNAIAGVVATLSCLNTVFALSSQRFFSVAIGKGDNVYLNKIYSTSININLMFSGIIIVLFETIGLWFITTSLAIPADRMFAAQWTFQFAIFAFVNSILMCPFMAAVFAHEHMGAYTIVSTIECLLKVLLVCLMKYSVFDNLVVYGAGLWIISLIILITYIVVSRLSYPECRYHKVTDKKLYKSLLSFSGWALFGAIAAMLMIQGNTIIIQVFFGSLVTAAFAIALQINGAFSSLCNSIVLAIRPAMIQSYAEKNFQFLNQLFVISNKCIFYILLLIAVPIIGEMNSILRLWLGDFDTNMVTFCRLIIIYVIVLAMHNPITIIMHASGHIKNYHVISESIILLCLPVTWILYKFGFPPYVALISMISVCSLAHVARIICLNHYYKEFSISNYIIHFILPSAGILLMTAGTTYLIHANISDDYEFIRVVTLCLVTPCILGILIYFVGMTDQERELIHNKVGGIIKRK